MPSTEDQLRVLEEERMEILKRVRKLSIDPVVQNSPAISEIQNSYNGIMRQISSLNVSRLLDPLDILPFELFIDCIKLALPLLERGYTASLLQLTLVSRRWSEALLSNPTFWTMVTINGYEEDSLAMLETSLCLSRGLGIFLTVCPPTFEASKEAFDAIVPHSDRI